MKNLTKFIRNHFRATLAGFALIVGLALSPSANAQLTTVVPVTATTPTNLLSGGKYVITSILFINGNSSNAATVKIYDSAGATNYVQPAYVSYAAVATNWSSIFTNADGLIVTNTFTGISNFGTSVAASTNERPAKLTFLCGANTSRTVNTVFQPTLGATLYSTTAGTVEVAYRQISP